MAAHCCARPRRPRKLDHLASLALLACAAALLPATPIASDGASRPRACEQSGYCSVGISRRWVGDIRESAAFRDMLEAVAFKRELIIVVFAASADATGVWTDQVGVRWELQTTSFRRAPWFSTNTTTVAVFQQVLQLHYEFLSMGFGHHVFVARAAEACAQASPRSSPPDVFSVSEDMMKTAFHAYATLCTCRLRGRR